MFVLRCERDCIDERRLHAKECMHRLLLLRSPLARQLLQRLTPFVEVERELSIVLPFEEVEQPVRKGDE